jgi:hypothetical protein
MLDVRSKYIIKKLIENKVINNYNDLEKYLKDYFDSNTFSSTEYIRLFGDRQQRQVESLPDYYTAISDLATQAYPDTPKSIVEEYFRKQFIIGLNNTTIRDEIMIRSKTDNSDDILARALVLQSKLASVSNLVNRNNAIESYTVQHMVERQNFNNANSYNASYQTNNPAGNVVSSSNNYNYNTPNNQNVEENRTQWTEFMRQNYVPYKNNENQTNDNQTRSNLCYNCNQPGHFGRDCKQRRNNISSNRNNTYNPTVNNATNRNNMPNPRNNQDSNNNQNRTNTNQSQTQCKTNSNQTSNPNVNHNNHSNLNQQHSNNNNANNQGSMDYNVSSTQPRNETLSTQTHNQ